MGWVMAYCARRVQEGLVKSFARRPDTESAPSSGPSSLNCGRQDGLPQQTMADRFHRSKVAAFHLITKLEQQGIVERRPNPEDGRSKLVHLTDAGARRWRLN